MAFFLFIGGIFVQIVINHTLQIIISLICTPNSIKKHNGEETVSYKINRRVDGRFG
jgi:hypothetical protein